VPAKLDELAERKLRAGRRDDSHGDAVRAGRTTFVDVGDRFTHTNQKIVKKSDPRYRGPLWKPDFTVRPHSL
jgi:hypothetical protein